MNTGEDLEIAEGPVTIYIREILDAQKTDRLWRKTISGKGRGTGQFIETDEVVPRWIPPEESSAQNIVVPEALPPRLPNLTHHAKLADHFVQKKMYERLKKSFYWPQIVDEVATTVLTCPPGSRNRLQIPK